MATEGSWPSIEKYGLQCTKTLLDRYKASTVQRDNLLLKHRPESVAISSIEYPNATIRDQKPMSDKGLQKALGGSCTTAEWYELLNSRVFFWLTEERLKTMLGARTYKNSKHDVLTIDTRKLVNDYSDRILLSPMNSGNTKPFPHPRTPAIFQSIQAFPFAERRKTRKLKDTVVELTVETSVPNIADYVIDVSTISIADLN